MRVRLVKDVFSLVRAPRIFMREQGNIGESKNVTQRHAHSIRKDEGQVLTEYALVLFLIF